MGKDEEILELTVQKYSGKPETRRNHIEPLYEIVEGPVEIRRSVSYTQSELELISRFKSQFSIEYPKKRIDLTINLAPEDITPLTIEAIKQIADLHNQYHEGYKKLQQRLSHGRGFIS